MKQSLLNISQIFSKKKAYTSLKKISIAKWNLITEHGSFNELVIEGEFSNLELYNVYLDLLQQYYDEFGTTETYDAFMDAKLDYALKLAAWITTQNGSDRMFLEMARIDYNESMPKKENGESFKLSEQISVLVEYYKVEYDEETMSAHKFYSRKKNMEKRIQQQIDSLKNG